jgi:oligopeptidase B
MRYSVALLVLAGFLASAPAKPPESPALQPAQPSAPVAKKEPRVFVLHGDRRVDDYFWLRNKGAPEVVDYLKAENAYTDAVMKPTELFQEQLYQEMLARIRQTDITAPYPQGQWLYYSRTETGKQYPIYCRRQSTGAPEHVLLDLNEIAQGEKFLALDTSEVSDDGNLLAYSTDNSNQRLAKRRARKRSDPPEWTALPGLPTIERSSTWWRTTLSAPNRLYRHRVGSPPESDVLLYEERDEMFRLSVRRSRSLRYLFLISASRTAREVRFLPADRTNANFELSAAREKDHEYYVDHRGGDFLIRTNSGGLAPAARREKIPEALPCIGQASADQLDRIAN